MSDFLYKIVKKFEWLQSAGDIHIALTTLRLGSNYGNRPIVGIDPGQVNMGLAYLYKRWAYLYQIKFPGSLNSVERIQSTINVVSWLLNQMPEQPVAAVVEQAAYSKMYGQAALSENRTSAIVSLLKIGTPWIQVEAPGTIRVNVFGNGRQTAEMEWPDLPKDAATAFSCALYAEKIFREQIKALEDEQRRLSGIPDELVQIQKAPPTEEQKDMADR